METEREVQLARNEDRFRRVNERIRRSRPVVDAASSLAFTCECDRLGCTEIITVPIGVYEEVRRHGRRFLIAPGHGDPRIERVVAAGGRYEVVEKRTGPAADVAEATDPRGA